MGLFCGFSSARPFIFTNMVALFFLLSITFFAVGVHLQIVGAWHAMALLLCAVAEFRSAWLARFRPARPIPGGTKAIVAHLISLIRFTFAIKRFVGFIGGGANCCSGARPLRPGLPGPVS